MKYPQKKTIHTRSCNARFLVSALCLSILLLQVGITCGANPQAHSSTALAASHAMSCVNPVPPDNGTTAPPAPDTPGIVVINEVLPFAQVQWNCITSGNNAWLEIYNPQNQPYDLYAAQASIDEGPNTASFAFPLGSIISAHGFFVVFPFGNLYTDTLTQLPPVRLLFNSQVIDQVSIPYLTTDTSYARIPDGSNNWQITTTPTIGSSNQYTTGTTQTANSTSTPTHTTKPKTSSTHNNGTSTDNTSTDPSTTSVQPTWSTLLLPSAEPNNSTIQQSNSSLASTTPTPSTAPFDLLKKILLTLLIIILFSALLLGWQLYQKRRATKARP